LISSAEHIPNILPKTDYYLLVREYRKKSKKIRDKVLITRNTLIDEFGKYFEIIRTKIIMMD
jgi:hypothetical protein